MCCGRTKKKDKPSDVSKRIRNRDINGFSAKKSSHQNGKRK